MKSRERFLKTINRKVPDRPPVFATFTPQVAQKMSKFMNVPYEKPLDSMLSTRASHMDLLVELGNDAVGIATCAPDNFPTKTLENGLIENEWGMVFKPMGLYNEFHVYPLATAETAEDIANHKFPVPFAEGRWKEAEKTTAKYGKTHGIIAGLETTLFETAWYLVGLEKFLMDLMSKIRSKETKPEIKLRKFLWNLGIRYRKNVKKLPGTPDIVISKYRMAIFVDGEFWHGYNWGEKKNKIKSNRDFWIPKIERNMQRDRFNNQLLSKNGWTVLRFWDTQIKKEFGNCLFQIIDYIDNFETFGTINKQI